MFQNKNKPEKNLDNRIAYIGESGYFDYNPLRTFWRINTPDICLRYKLIKYEITPLNLPKTDFYNPFESHLHLKDRNSILISYDIQGNRKTANFNFRFIDFIKPASKLYTF